MRGNVGQNAALELEKAIIKPDPSPASTGAALAKDEWPNSPEAPNPLKTGLLALV